jgi:hypothetical protein
MWRDPFLNLFFVILVITVLALQHSVTVFGPALRGGAMPHIDLPRNISLWFGDEFSSPPPTPAPVARAAAFFDNAWHRSMAFEEWWLDYTASQWELYNASSPAESDLLEARFHVANAEVLTDALRENARAIKELARAETSLDAARAIAGPSLTRQLSTVSEQIATAESHEQTEDASSTVHFEAIKADLDHLIAFLRLSKT